MIGLFFENENIFKKLNIFKGNTNPDICQLYITSEYGLPIQYIISDLNIYMSTVLTYQLINEDSDMLIVFTLIPDNMKGAPDAVQIVNVLNKEELKFPSDPIFVRYNDNLTVPIDFRFRFDSLETAIVYVCTMFDVKVLFFKIKEEFLDNFGQSFSKKLPELLSVDLETSLEHTTDVNYALLKSFDRVTDSLMYYAKMRNKTEDDFS